MTHVTQRAQYCAFVEEAAPSARNFTRHTYLQVSGTSGKRYWTVLWFANPFPSTGANVTKAVLTVRLRANTNTSHAITAQLADKWAASFWTLDWTTKPSGTGPRTDATRTGALKTGDLWQIDVTAQMQRVADGQRFYGLLLWSPLSGDTVTMDGSAGATPTLDIDWWSNPLPPTDMSPTSGAVVGTPTPTLRWTFYDHAGRTDIATCQVQTASTQTGFSSPSWDSGQVATTLCQMETSSVSGWPKLAVGSRVWWRVRIQDGSGLWSGWSAPASMTYQSLPVVTLTYPSSSSPTVTDPTPPITWTVTPGSGGAVTHWRVIVSRWDGASLTQIDSSGVIYTSATSWTPTVPMASSGRYQVLVQAWDGLTQRVGTPGCPPRGEASATVSYAPSATVSGVSSLTADQDRTRPEVRLSWSRSELPDEWIILRDGVQVDRVSGATWGSVASGFGRWVYVASGRHTVGVQAVVNGKASTPTQITVERDLQGTWLIDPDTDEAVGVVGDTDHDLKMPEVSASLEPLGSPRVVVIVSAQRGYEGTVSGMLVPLSGIADTPDVWSRRLLGWKTRIGHRFLLVIEDQVLPVNVSNVQLSSVNRKAGRMWRTSFDFHQIDQFPFGGDA
ncbi:glycoside hydrolase family 78 protein [Acidipropionibacterium timonense]|uniref:glycoside hydrolase family 78 protein n=1 Tax=Acidipropionibacterium timonense TaxID=2161818 RepID=UPI001030A184|nr:DNRLRE domain-containing protein [Acidipropionibacterium timonense]